MHVVKIGKINKVQYTKTSHISGTSIHDHDICYFLVEIWGSWMKGTGTYTQENYRQVSNISHTLAGNNFAYHSDVVGASPVGAAPTTSSFST